MTWIRVVPKLDNLDFLENQEGDIPFYNTNFGAWAHNALRETIVVRINSTQQFLFNMKV